MEKRKTFRYTNSVCPVCLMRLPAVVVKRGDEYFLEKTCPVHGDFSTVVWRGNDPLYEEWVAGYTPPAENESNAPDCPKGCGLCADHLQKTCCALVEVTSRCDLKCPVCFADSGTGGTDPTVDELHERFILLAEAGNTFVQLSGGEPTERDDLSDIIAAAKSAGCENIQLNSNGVRLGRDKGLANVLRDAGLSFVFMQFDGTEDDIYMKLRGRPLLKDKTAAIRNCADAYLGVTLVPTLVPGVNCHNIGDIINFGFANSPAVRGVHFQPVSYFGRYPHPPENKNRITLPEVLRDIAEQTGGKLSISNFAPSRCDHPYCGFHGDFVVLPKGKIMKLTRKNTAPCCGDDAHLKNRSFVARRWNRYEGSGSGSGNCGNGDGSQVNGSDSSSGSDCCGGDDFTELNAFAARVKSHGFTITAMAFQDAYNLDIERLRRCSLHVSEQGRMIPFCAKYLTNV